MSTGSVLFDRIRLQGHLIPSWSESLYGMSIETVDPGPPQITLLSGKLPDQSAPHGVLHALLELHLPTLSTESDIVGAASGEEREEIWP